ncbi:MAG: hypothetical protein MZU84_02050 [Sphingobacterium sp.]|nr:hypothetical protein [Sphingobacterium sp.]
MLDKQGVRLIHVSRTEFILQFKLITKAMHSSARAGLVEDGPWNRSKPPFSCRSAPAGAVKALHIKELRDEVNAQIMLGEYLSPLSQAGVLNR